MVVGPLGIWIAIGACSKAVRVRMCNTVISEHVVVGGYRHTADCDGIAWFGSVSKLVALYDVVPDIRLAGGLPGCSDIDFCCPRRLTRLRCAHSCYGRCCNLFE